VSQSRSSERPLYVKGWWFVEVWQDGREGFKALVEHVFSFILLIGTLILFRYVFKSIDLAKERKEILETIDFWGIALALAIFGLVFLYKLVSSAIETAKEKAQAKRLLKRRMQDKLKREIGLEGEALDRFINQELFRIGSELNNLRY
jgi:hypothetical protein